VSCSVLLEMNGFIFQTGISVLAPPATPHYTIQGLGDHFKGGQRKWPSRTEIVLPCGLLWWQVGFGAPAPRGVNVPDAALVGRFSGDTHWPVLGDR